LQRDEQGSRGPRFGVTATATTTPTDCAHHGNRTPSSPHLVHRSDLRGKGLRGPIPVDPTLWGDLPGLENVDLSDNPGLTGGVPSALSAAPSLATM
jgi:hypothetical protein